MRRKSAVYEQNDRAEMPRVRGMYGSMHTDMYSRGGFSGLFSKETGILKPASKKAERSSSGAATKADPGTASKNTSRPGSGKASGPVSGKPLVPVSGQASKPAGLDGAFAGGAASARASALVSARAAALPGVEIVKGRRILIDTDAKSPLQRLRELLKGITLRAVLITMAMLAVISVSVILMAFNLKKAVVYGNTMYSQEQIEAFLTKGRLGNNTVIMALKYHQRKVKDIPFIERIDVDIVSPSTVRVNIKEKPADGFIYYGGKNVFFSKEGVIQTVSGRSVENSVKVNGVVLTHSNTGSRLLAKNQLGVDLSLEAMRVMDKYGILKEADAIDVDEKCYLTVTFDDVRVRIGRNGYDEKMYKMHQILPYLEGRSGVIQMTGTEFTGENIVLSPETPAGET